MITLMYKQLFRYLERRPEKYSQEGRNCEQILLLMDEFPRFGRIEGMDSAMATLRSKRVSICLMIQSLAQLDELYGKNGRRTILDNCSYKVILGANDPETTKGSERSCRNYPFSTMECKRQSEPETPHYRI